MTFRNAREPSPDGAGDRLRAPGKLHSFNRYELKYLVPVEQIDPIREELSQRMERDPYAGPQGYPVWSIYYDTAALRFYWEKIEGLKFRRKLRIRRYGELTEDAADDAPVSVEIKQRVNRVTQKRRVMLPYNKALDLCDRRQPVSVPGTDPDRRAAGQDFIDEVLDLVTRLDLRATAMTGYLREPYIGVDSDLGLRVTFDHRVRGRDRDFDLRSETENRYIIPPRFSVMEIKVNERAPYWITDLTARHGLQIQRISKYCQSIEAHGLAPRSASHIPLDQSPLSSDTTMSVTRSAAESAVPSAPQPVTAPAPAPATKENILP